MGTGLVKILRGQISGGIRAGRAFVENAVKHLKKRTSSTEDGIATATALTPELLVRVTRRGQSLRVPSLPEENSCTHFRRGSSRIRPRGKRPPKITSASVSCTLISVRASASPARAADAADPAAEDPEGDPSPADGSRTAGSSGG